MVSRIPLYVLANDVASGIERNTRRKATAKDYQEVRELSAILLEVSKRGMLDPIDTGIYGGVVWPHRQSREGKTMDELRLQLHLFSKELSNFNELSYRRQLDLAYACIDLSYSYRGFISSDISRSLVA